MDVQIHDVHVRTHQTKTYVPIHEHPYYVALHELNPTLYHDYIQHSAYQSSKPSGSWMGFVELARALYVRGLAFSTYDPIQVVHTRTGWQCRHGKHRACIIRFLYGPDATLRIEKGVVVSVHPGMSYNLLQHIRIVSTLFLR